MPEQNHAGLRIFAAETSAPPVSRVEALSVALVFTLAAGGIPDWPVFASR
jgi:hypothetical protein